MSCWLEGQQLVINQGLCSDEACASSPLPPCTSQGLAAGSRLGRPPSPSSLPAQPPWAGTSLALQPS